MQRNGNRGGVWRLPPDFDGWQRKPLPRFTVLSDKEIAEILEFFAEWATLLRRVVVPGAHVLVASNALLSHVIGTAIESAGFERVSGITAVDWWPREPRFEVVYLLHSMRHNVRLRLNVRVDEDEVDRPDGRVRLRRLGEGGRVGDKRDRRLRRRCRGDVRDEPAESRAHSPGDHPDSADADIQDEGAEQDDAEDQRDLPIDGESPGTLDGAMAGNPGRTGRPGRQSVNS